MTVERTLPGLTLGVLTPDEWRLWRDLRLQMLTSDPDGFGSTKEQEAGYDEALWRTRLEHGRSVVARLDGTPVAMGGSYEEEPGWHTVVSMWVDPALRGRGLGRLVLEDVVAAVGRTGCRVRLWVTDGNPARRLYVAAGFVDSGRSAPLRPGSSVTKSEMVLPEGLSG